MDGLIVGEEEELSKSIKIGSMARADSLGTGGGGGGGGFITAGGSSSGLYNKKGKNNKTSEN